MLIDINASATALAYEQIFVIPGIITDTECIIKQSELNLNIPYKSIN
jgi:hypothetical protein